MPCPRCGGRLRFAGSRKKPKRRLVCSRCGYSRYVSPRAVYHQPSPLRKLLYLIAWPILIPYRLIKKLVK